PRCVIPHCHTLRFRTVTTQFRPALRSTSTGGSAFTVVGRAKAKLCPWTLWGKHGGAPECQAMSMELRGQDRGHTGAVSPPKAKVAVMRRRALVATVFLLSRARAFVLVLMIGGGLAMVAWGAVLSSRAGNAVPILVAAFVLVLAGLFGDRVTHLTAKWGDKEIAVNVAESTAKLRNDIDELAEAKDVPEPVRTELRRLGDEAGVVSEAAADIAQSARPAERRPRSTRTRPYEATHLISETGQDVLLELKCPHSGLFGPWQPHLARCTVSLAAGPSSTVEREIALLPLGPATVTVRWPDEFPDPDVRSGKYYVDWSVKQPFGISALMGSPWDRVAIDAFQME
ncbi:MAG: hypothetical protein ACREA0_01010, partial [bacterium]